MTQPYFLSHLKGLFPHFEEAQAQKIQLFRDLVLEENSKQNLTRLISTQDFLEGHVFDCVELLKTGFLEYPALDLGSGAGVPGLICAILDNQKWVLAESEKNKAMFLELAARELDLQKVQVFAGRAEEFLMQFRDRKLRKAQKKLHFDWSSTEKPLGFSIVARAIGPVERIYSWIRRCSTWNRLILLKGPGWDEEWRMFQKSSHRKELQVLKTHSYLIGQEQKRRVILLLQRK